MKLTLGWLKQHLETTASLDTIAEALTDLGMEVEGIEDPAAALGAFRICRVIEAVQHPNADRLRLCRVETYPDGPGGRTEEVQVVCGAPNARTGLVGVFAPVGTHVPGTGVDLKPERRGAWIVGICVVGRLGAIKPDLEAVAAGADGGSTAGPRALSAGPRAHSADPRALRARSAGPQAQRARFAGPRTLRARSTPRASRSRRSARGLGCAGSEVTGLPEAQVSRFGG